MKTTKTRRKRRSDCNNVIYQITCKATGERYRGFTFARNRAFQKTAKIRWKLHVCQAQEPTRNGKLQQRIREYGDKGFIVEVLEVVRGKQAALTREKELIRELDPSFDMNEQSLRPRKRRRNDLVLTA